MGRREAARRQFTLALERAPNRALSVAGLTQTTAQAFSKITFTGEREGS